MAKRRRTRNLAGFRRLKPGHPLAFDFTYALTRALFWPVSRLHVYGREHLEAHRRGACLMAANHISHFDAFLLAHAHGRRIDYLTAAEFFRPALVGALMRGGGAFPFDRARSGYRAARIVLRRLEAGRMVGIFPEGGIRDGAGSVLAGAPLKPGMGRLARLSGAPVLPAVILGADRLYDPRRWLPRGKRVPVWIGFGPSIVREEWDAPGALASLLGDRLRDVYARMKAEFRLQPDDLPMTAQQRQAHG